MVFYFIIGISPGLGAPPKPQRLFQSALAPQPAAKTQSVVDSRINESGNLITHINPTSVQNRPLPDRPCSVAGQYPASDKRMFQDYPPGYLTSPGRRLANNKNLLPDARASYASQGYRGNFEDHYGTYGTRPGNVTPIIDEEARLRVNYMERQLASLTGIVQKALLTHPNQPKTTGSPGSEQKG